MKKILLTLGFLLCLLPLAFGQDSALFEINQLRLQTNKTAMFVLGGWAVGNMAVSGILRGQTEGSTRYFHEMNVFWNLVNLGIAGASLYGTYTTDPSGMGMWETYHEQQKLEKILWFNVALNASYMLGGAWLIERSKSATRQPMRLKGYGQSLILQGGFLLVYDTIHVLIQQHNSASRLQDILQQVSFTGNGISIGFIF